MNSSLNKIYWAVIKLSRKNKLSRYLIDWAGLFYYKVFRGNKVFIFNNIQFKYFYHRYNRTIASERTVEIPIAKYYLDKHKNRNTLEVGNVMKHYYNCDHDVLDKYEKASGVINEDVVDFHPNKKYDFIFSISTLEHVGWTYTEEIDQKKFIRAVENLQRLLKKDGTMLITIPVDYREDLRSLISNNKMPFQEEFFMKRISFLNEWEQVRKKDAIGGPKYDQGFANANALYIGLFQK